MHKQEKGVEIFVFPSGPIETNGYMIVVGHHAALIDAPPTLHEKIEEIVEERQLHIEKLILTHSHWDHIADANILRALYHPSISVHEEDLPNLVRPGADGLPFRMTIAPCMPDQILKDGDTLTLGSTTWHVIHTPGHSPGCICLFEPHEKLLFSGDTLFKSSIGNLSFPTSQPERMWQSLKKLSTLPAETQVFPGHGGETTIGKERWLNRAEQIFG